jgi:hypothetical protein
VLDELRLKEGEPVCLVHDHKFSKAITDRSPIVVTPTKLTLAYKEGAVTLCSIHHPQPVTPPLFSLSSEPSMVSYLKGHLKGYFTVRQNQDLALPVGSNHFFHFKVENIHP